MLETEYYGTNSQMHRLCVAVYMRIKEVGGGRWEENGAGVFETVKHP